LGITALEDKIVQRAEVTVLNAIYEEDFLGFPGSQNVCARATHIESVEEHGDDGVHQEHKWTPWNTPNYPPGGVTARLSGRRC
jgi:hypothetical protein